MPLKPPSSPRVWRPGLCGLALVVTATPLWAQAPGKVEPSSGLAEQAAAVCRGQTRSETLVSEALRRARDAAPYNAFIHVDDAGALAAARAADLQVRRGAKPCPPLAGVPIVVKDNIHVAGMPATGGTPALQGRIPAADAGVVARLKAAGAVVIGKTQMHELAFGISGYNPAYMTGTEPGVRNAYDRSRSAGGSSSGTGAALGLRVVAGGLGTDTGGSVRVPCAFNGCAALRPTVGRYPADGMLPISHTRDTAGPMARTVADVELMDRVITGAAPQRPAALKRIRLGLVPAFTAGLDADTEAAFNDALTRLKAAGVTLVPVELPGLMALNDSISFPVAMHEAYDDGVAYLARYHPGLSIAQLAEAAASPDVKGTYLGLVIPRKLPGPHNTLVDSRPAYDAAMAQGRPALKRLYAEAFAQHRLDALVMPTVPHVAMAAGPDSSAVPVFMGAIRNTDPGSNAGIPSLQLPIARGASTGLPIGLMLDGPAGSDRRLLGLGLAIQALFAPLPPPTR